MPSSDALFDGVIAVTLAAGAIGVGALAARRATAAVRNMLWRFVVLSFWLVPLCVGLTRMGDIRYGMLALPAVPPIPLEAPSPHSFAGHGASTGAGTAASPTAPTVTEDDAYGPEQAEDSIPVPAFPLSPIAVLLGAWLMGVLLAVALLIRDAWLLATIIRGASPPVHLPDHPTGHDTEQAHTGRPRPVLASESVTCPVAAGVLRPVILVPAGCAETECSGGVLAHELAHIARGDLWMLLLARITRCVWWWHPLAWLAARGLESTSEEACDDWAVAATGNGRSYADSIVRWAEAGTPALGTPVSRCGANLIRRVKRLVEGRVGSPHVANRTRAALVAGVVVVMLLAGAVQLRALEPSPLADADLVRILLLGIDERPGDRGRSDTIMVMMVSPKQRRMAILSIPRDLRVQISERGPDKINAAYAFGSAELSVRTVEALLGQQIDGHVVMRMEDLERMIDALGGVELMVPDYEGDLTRGRHHGMHYTDNWGKLEIALQPGRQQLNGEQAAGFARYRHSRYGCSLNELGRIKNQQTLLAALFDQKLPKLSRTQLLDVLGTCLQYVETDLTWADAVALARVLPTLQSADVRFETVPVVDASPGGIYYSSVIPDDLAQCLQAIALHLRVEADDVGPVSAGAAGIGIAPAEPAATPTLAADATVTDSHAEAPGAMRSADAPPTGALPPATEPPPASETPTPEAADATPARERGPEPPSTEMVWPADGDVTRPYGLRYHPILKRSKMHTG